MQQRRPFGKSSTHSIQCPVPGPSPWEMPAAPPHTCTKTCWFPLLPSARPRSNPPAPSCVASWQQWARQCRGLTAGGRRIGMTAIGCTHNLSHNNDKNTFFVLSYKAPETGTNTLRMHTLRRGENQHVDLAARLFVSGEYKHRLFIMFLPSGVASGRARARLCNFDSPAADRIQASTLLLAAVSPCWRPLQLVCELPRRQLTTRQA